MFSVHDILTGVGETSELDALREVLGTKHSKVVVLDDEARRRALQKRMERQQLRLAFLQPGPALRPLREGSIDYLVENPV
jgi:hypothetical protein